MRCSRVALEAALYAITTTTVACASLLRSSDDESLKQAAILALLCLLACTFDSCTSGARCPRYVERAAEDSGSGLGALALPWVLAGLVAAAGHPGTLLLSFCSSVAGSAMQLCLLCWPAAGLRRSGSPEKPHSTGSRSVGGGGWGTALRAGAAGLAAVASLLSGSLAGAAAVLGLAVTCCMALHALMSSLPRTFTAGEGMVLSQAAVLLAAYTARVVTKCGSSLGLPLSGGQHITSSSSSSSSSSSGSDVLQGWECDAASPFQAFVACLVFGCATLAVLVTWLMGRAQPGSQAGGYLAGEQGPGAKNGSTGTGQGVRNGQQGQQQRELHQRRFHFEAAANEQAVNSSSSRVVGSGRQAHLPWWRAAAAAAVLAWGALALIKPALWSLSFATSSWRRAGVLAYWVALMLGTLPAMRRLAGSGQLSNILVRKGYHVLAVALFLPATALEPQLLGISLAIAFAALTVVELVRVTRAPFIGNLVNDFMTAFIDSRDSGAILVTHFTLLLGMAAPLWLSDALLPPPSAASGGSSSSSGLGAGSEQGQGGAVPAWPAGLAGIMIIGFGDTMASVVGRLAGRHPVFLGSQKSWEGTLGGTAATLAGWWLAGAVASWLVSLTGSGADSSSSSNGSNFTAGSISWAALAGATALSSLLEAVTCQLDNLFVPLHYFALLCCCWAFTRVS